MPADTLDLAETGFEINKINWQIQPMYHMQLHLKLFPRCGHEDRGTVKSSSENYHEALSKQCGKW